MKKFKFKFNKLTLAFIFTGIALAAVAFIVNTYLLLKDGVDTAQSAAYPVIQYTLMYFVSVFLFAILLSLLLSSYYAIDGKTLKTSFGIIKSKFDVEKIQSVILDREANKLHLYFDNNTFNVINVNPDWYEDFTNALLEANPKIEFSIKSKENSIDKDDKK